MKYETFTVRISDRKEKTAILMGNIAKYLVEVTDSVM